MGNNLVKASLILSLSHGFEPAGHTLGVAEFATLRDLGAASGRVPGLLGPFNAGGSHRADLLLRQCYA